METNLVGKPVQQPFYETFFSQKSTPHPALRPRQMGVLFLIGARACRTLAAGGRPVRRHLDGIHDESQGRKKEGRPIPWHIGLIPGTSRALAAGKGKWESGVLVFCLDKAARIRTIARYEGPQDASRARRFPLEDDAFDLPRCHFSASQLHPAPPFFRLQPSPLSSPRLRRSGRLRPTSRSGHRLFQRPARQKQIPSSPPPGRGLGKTEMKRGTERQFHKSLRAFYLKKISGKSGFFDQEKVVCW
jgi:hypothetical protein